MTLLDSFKKSMGTAQFCASLVLLNYVIAMQQRDIRKKYLSTEDLKTIYEIKRKPKKKTRQDFANEEFAEFEPLGNGIGYRQGINNFVRSWK